MHSRTAAASPLAIRCRTDGLIDCIAQLFELAAKVDSAKGGFSDHAFRFGNDSNKPRKMA
jgi:hypothetical protein